MLSLWGPFRRHGGFTQRSRRDAVERGLRFWHLERLPGRPLSVTERGLLSLRPDPEPAAWSLVRGEPAGDQEFGHRSGGHQRVEERVDVGVLRVEIGK